MFVIVQNGSKLHNWIPLVKIGPNLSKLDQTYPNWIKIIQIGSDLSNLDPTCPNSLWLTELDFFPFHY